jgi:ADP-heptose:LPS heptosyltransferase
MAVRSMAGPVLALRALGLGDLLTSVPALRALKRSFPESPLILAAPSWLRPVVPLVGGVAELVPAGPLAPLPSRAHGAALAVNLHGRGPQSHRILAGAAPGKRLAFRHPDVGWSCDGPEWNDAEHEVRRWCRLLRHFGIRADPADLRIAHPAGVDRDGDVTVVHPGAASGSRRWPAERFAQVARSEAERGQVVVTGSTAELPLCRRVAAEAGLARSAVAAGGSLDGLISRVARAARVVCGDTGAAHLATALGTPSVVLFGPTPPDRWGALIDRPLHREIWMGRSGDPHADVPFEGLLEIGVERVLRELEVLEAQR